MMVFGDSNFTGDTPKSSSSGMSSKALHPLARMGTMKRSRLKEETEPEISKETLTLFLSSKTRSSVTTTRS